VASSRGGAGEDVAYDVRLAGSGQVGLVGETGSEDFPTEGASFQPSYGGGLRDGFVAVLSTGLGRVLQSSFLGGSGADTASTLDFAAGDRAAVAGTTKSADFPLGGLATERLSGPSDAFLAFFLGAARTEAVGFARLYGGAGKESAAAVEATAGGDLLLLGLTYSASLPGVTTPPGATAGNTFVTRFAATGQILSGAVLGSELDDVPVDLEVGDDGFLFLAGCLLEAAGTEGGGGSSESDSLQPGDNFAARLALP
jgi:hypothetical protein